MAVELLLQWEGMEDDVTVKADVVPRVGEHINWDRRRGEPGVPSFQGLRVIDVLHVYRGKVRRIIVSCEPATLA